MILYERACIGEPIGLLISQSACTFTLSGRCARVKKVRVCAVYMPTSTNSLPFEIHFYYCSNLPSNEKSFRERHRKKSFPVAIVFMLPRMTLSMMLAADIFNFIAKLQCG